MSMILDSSVFSRSIDFIFQDEPSSSIWQGIERREFLEDEVNKQLGRRDYVYHEDGILIGSQKINTQYYIISIYFMFARGDYEGYSCFQHEIPYGISSITTRKEVISTLGEPQLTGGDFDDELLGYQHPWIKYYPKDNVQFMVELKNDRVWRVNIGRAFYVT